MIKVVVECTTVYFACDKRNCDDPVDVPDNVGQCSEEGLLAWLGIVQRWRENNVSDNTTYADRATQEINNFINATNGRVFGRCPCTTGNVREIMDAEKGRARDASPGFQAYAQTNYPGFWYSYSYFENLGPSTNLNFRYLKLY